METDTNRDRRGESVVSRRDRDMVARQLAGAAADDRISSEELQTRLGRAHQARTYDDLEQLLADLPGTQEPEERTVAAYTVPETLHITASLRNARRHGRWKVPRRVVASAGLGDVDLDFTEAEIQSGEVTVDARPNLSDVDIVVPEGHGVSIEEAVPGPDSVHDQTTAPQRPGAPRVHILGRPGIGSIRVYHPRQHGIFLRALNRFVSTPVSPGKARQTR